MPRCDKARVPLLLVAISLWLTACGAEPDSTAHHDHAATVELTVSAAASLTDALNEIKKAFETEHESMKISFNFGASGALQQQIEQGAPVDLFLAAAPKHMKTLVGKQLIDVEEQTTLLTNELVVVVPNEANASISGLTDLAKTEVLLLAIGIPESVPAGSYAKEALVNAQLWDAVQAKTVQAKDVRQVLHYVGTGNADAGFVYKTDALASERVKIAFMVNSESYTAVEYPVGIVKSTKHREAAEQLYTYLQSEEALDVFEAYGFSIPNR